jgi:hypothetical protein
LLFASIFEPTLTLLSYGLTLFSTASSPESFATPKPAFCFEPKLNPSWPPPKPPNAFAEPNPPNAFSEPKPPNLLGLAPANADPNPPNPPLGLTQNPYPKPAAGNLNEFSPNLNPASGGLNGPSGGTPNLNFD